MPIGKYTAACTPAPYLAQFYQLYTGNPGTGILPFPIYPNVWPRIAPPNWWTAPTGIRSVTAQAWGGGGAGGGALEPGGSAAGGGGGAGGAFS